MYVMLLCHKSKIGMYISCIYLDTWIHTVAVYYFPHQ